MTVEEKSRSPFLPPFEDMSHCPTTVGKSLDFNFARYKAEGNWESITRQTPKYQQLTEAVDTDMAGYKWKIMWPFPWRSLVFGSPLSMTNMHNCEPPAASVFQRTGENEEMITYTFKPSFHLFVFVWETVSQDECHGSLFRALVALPQRTEARWWIIELAAHLTMSED